MSRVETEIELKIKLSSSDLEKVFAVFSRTARVKTAAKTRVYYDTPNLDLHAQGFSLRLEPDGKTQTFKMGEGAAAGGALSRRECKDEVRDGAPSLAAVTDPAARAALAALPSDAPLIPVFTADLTRRAFDLEVEGGTVELAFDTGALVVTGDRARQDFHEIEIELKHGPAAIIEALRAEIFTLAPSAAVQPFSKAAQGVRLFHGNA